MKRATPIKLVLLSVCAVGMYLTVVGLMILYMDYPMDLGQRMNRDGLLFILMGVMGIIVAGSIISGIDRRDETERTERLLNELYAAHLSLYHRICDLNKSADNQTETGQKPN